MPRRIAELVERFERLAFERATSETSRIVKLIGDEVMFVASDAERGVEIAIDLVDAVADLPLRAGIAHGDTLTYQGTTTASP